MCGILGWSSPRPVDPALFDQALDIMHHRGPDDRGTWRAAVGGSEGGELHLGHRRLSILDLSPRGHQPMGTPDGRWTITYNGEIFNFRDVRADLQKRGYTF